MAGYFSREIAGTVGGPAAGADADSWAAGGRHQPPPRSGRPPRKPRREGSEQSPTASLGRIRSWVEPRRAAADAAPAAARRNSCPTSPHLRRGPAGSDSDVEGADSQIPARRAATPPAAKFPIRSSCRSAHRRTAAADEAEQLVVHRGAAAMNDYQFQLTDLGRERARRLVGTLHVLRRGAGVTCPTTSPACRAAVDHQAASDVRAICNGPSTIC